ncbi:MAG: pentapeptide repeat-containing protein [Flavobacteriales bacterium]|nr:pentapeptide repeat-containing protein [Flavobacteriales bacterium]
MKIIEEKKFTAQDFKKCTLEIAQYELCEFHNIDFSNQSFSEAKFIECRFVGCDLSLINLTYAAFQEVSFDTCKMLGLYFDTCSNFLFQAGFKNCKLDNSSFYQVVLKQTVFQECSLQSVDFSEANLTQAKFLNSDLLNATFMRTNLSHADFSTASQFRIHPDRNQLKETQFSRSNLEGLLQDYSLKLVE